VWTEHPIEKGARCVLFYHDAGIGLQRELCIGTHKSSRPGGSAVAEGSRNRRHTYVTEAHPWKHYDDSRETSGERWVLPWSYTCTKRITVMLEGKDSAATKKNGGTGRYTG